MYKEINDSEVLYMINDSDDYLEIMIDKYKPVMVNICSKYQKIGEKVGYEFDDLMQIANIALIKAIKYYKENKNTLFYTFLTHCIENNLKSTIRGELTNRQKALNSSVSLDEILPNTNDNTLLDFIKDDKAIEPIEYLINKEQETEYIKFINSLPFEVAVAYEMKIQGFTNNEIAALMNMDKTTVYKSIKYARNKICLN